MANKDSVRVITFEQDGTFFAQCLEYDICAHASDEATLKIRFEALFNFERNLSIERNGAPFAGIDAAPPESHDMWERCIKDAVESRVISGELISMARCA